MQTFVLQSNRLLLKVLDQSYAEEVLDFFIRNKDFLSPWEPVREETFYTIGYHEQLLKNELKMMAEGRLLKFWLFAKEEREANRVIGSIALNEIIRGCFHSCFLGYRVDGDRANRGYITEGTEKVIEYAFFELGLHRIEANIMPHNRASLQVVRKLGFYDEGLAAKYLKINGKWENHIHMVLRNEALE